MIAAKFIRRVAMRRFLLTVATTAIAASSAQAADMPDFLRGSLPASPPPAVNWQGFYIGGQAGYGSSDENFNGSTNNMVQALVANTVLTQTGIGNWNLNLGKDSSRTTGYGGFAGYNWQYDEVVVGVEASYLHGAFGGSATATEPPLLFGPLTDNNYHLVTASSTSAISISDMATFRARAGYAYGSFLPYMFGGVAFGNADISQSATVIDHWASTPANAMGSCLVAVCAMLNSSNVQHNHLLYGYSGGLGVDINLTGGLFFRAEWEYLRFAAVIDTSINTVRAGLGYKF
jgi:outer membrane immunogenic protein